MKKMDKKVDNALRGALTEVCELAIDEVSGFEWLTHFSNYRDFPASLLVVCVFSTKDELVNAQNTQQDDYLRELIHDKLSAANIQIKDIRQHVKFDTEEACEKEHAGKWNERFRR